MDNLVWNVFYHDMNKNEIKTFNVFQHGGFREDCILRRPTAAGAVTNGS